jgi:hypothetical protein
MDINTFDILLLFILAIAVSLIIGFNVMFIVNKKLSDIKINIPACSRPNVYIKSENGYLTKVEVDDVERGNDKINSIEHTKEIVETFRPTENTKNKIININSPNQPNCVLTVDMDKHNEYMTGYVTADGRIVNQDVNIFIPKTYMGVDPYGGKGVNYMNRFIEKPADVDQIGSIPVNDYNGQPKPTYSI